METLKCAICGADIEVDDKICKACGHIICDDEVVVKFKAAKRRSGNANNALNTLKENKASFIVKSIIFVLLSFALFVLSFFPVGNLTVELEQFGVDDEITVAVTPVKIITFYLDSFHIDDIVETGLYGKAEELHDELSCLKDCDDENLSHVEKRMAQKLMYLCARLTLRGDNTQSKTYMLLSAAASLIYIVFTLAFLIISILNFKGLLHGKRSLYSVCINLLCITPVFLIANYFLSTPWSQGFERISGEYEIGKSVVWSLVIILLCVLYILADRLIRTKKIQVKKLLANTLSIVLAGLVILLALSPVLKTEIFEVFSGNDRGRTAETTMDVKYFALLDIEKEELPNYRDAKVEVELNRSGLEDFTRSDVHNGLADGYVSGMLTNMGIYALTYNEYLPLFSWAYYMMFIASFAAMIIISQNLKYLCVKKKARWLVIIAKIICVIAAVTALVLIIIFVSVIKFAAQDLSIAKNISVSVGIAPILLVILCVGMLFVTSSDKIVVYRTKEEPKADENSSPMPEIF